MARWARSDRRFGVATVARFVNAALFKPCMGQPRCEAPSCMGWHVQHDGAASKERATGYVTPGWGSTLAQLLTRRARLDQ